jgi:ABC-type multidrug transport system fused ATPase/permease subunit
MLFSNKVQVNRNLHDAWNLLTTKEKTKYALLMVSSGAKAIVDLAILSMTVVIVSIATSASNSDSVSLLIFKLKLPKISNLDPSLRMVYAFMILFLLVLIKNIANYAIQSKNFKIDAEIGHRFSKNLLGGYLNNSFLFFLKSNSTEMLRNLESAKMITSHLLRPAVEVAVQVFGITLVVLVLFLTNPVATLLSLGGLALLSTLIYRFLGIRFRNIGSIERSLIIQRTKSGNNAILGIRDIKVARREDEFLNRYAMFDLERSKFQVKSQILNEVTPMALESLVAFSLVCVALAFRLMKLDNQDLATFIALFAVGSLRLVPNFAKIVAMKQMVLYGDSFISSVMIELEEMQSDHIKQVQIRNTDDYRIESVVTKDFPGSLSTENIFFENVFFKYPTAIDHALRNVDLRIESGVGIGIIGKSGAGKSTLVDLMLGLLVPTSGRISVGGTSIAEAIRTKRIVVGYVPQSVYFAEGTIKENIAFGLPEGEIDEDLIREVVHLSELDSLIAALPNGIDTQMGELGKLVSGGERQRIGIARALYRKPNLLVLDEATSSLDIQTEAAIVQTISKLFGKMTTVIIAHRLSTVEWCQSVAVINDATIANIGNPKDVIDDYLKIVGD